MFSSYYNQVSYKTESQHIDLNFFYGSYLRESTNYPYTKRDGTKTSEPVVLKLGM